MARIKRIVIPNTHHITQSGNATQNAHPKEHTWHSISVNQYEQYHVVKYK